MRTNSFLKFILSAIVVLVIIAVMQGGIAYAAKPVLENWKLHARCSQMAYMAGYNKLMKGHMNTAIILQPKTTSLPDIAFQQGYIYGHIVSVYIANQGESAPSIAKRYYKAICPSRA